jgi:ribosomal protein S3
MRGRKDLPVVCDTSQGVVPRHERRKDTEIASCLLACSVGSTSISLEVTDSKHQESQVQEEEEQEEGDSRSERANQQDESEDEPADKEESESVGKVVRTGSF